MGARALFWKGKTCYYVHWGKYDLLDALRNGTLDLALREFELRGEVDNRPHEEVITPPRDIEAVVLKSNDFVVISFFIFFSKTARAKLTTTLLMSEYEKEKERLKEFVKVYEKLRWLGAVSKKANLTWDEVIKLLNGFTNVEYESLSEVKATLTSRWFS